MGVGIEKDLLQQVVVFGEHAPGYLHVALESCARRILRLHDGGKDEGRDEGDAQRVSHRAVVLVERIFVDMEPETLIEVLEEDAAHVVALTDDDRVLLRELVEVGKGRTEHRVGRDVRMARLLIIILQPRLHGRDVGDDAVLRQVRKDLVERRLGELHRHGIDDELRGESLHLVHRRETLTVVGEAQPLGIALDHCHLMVKTEQVDKEGAHLTGSHNQYFHLCVVLFYAHARLGELLVDDLQLLAHALLVDELEHVGGKLRRHAAERGLRAALL